MMDYNVPLGKLNRGMAVLDVVQSLAEAKGAAPSAEDEFRANALGWCIEFLQVGGRYRKGGAACRHGWLAGRSRAGGLWAAGCGGGVCQAAPEAYCLPAIKPGCR